MQVAHRLEFYAEQGPFGLTTLFGFIKNGSLPARKRAGATFVIEDDWNRFLTDAPLAIDARRKRTSGEG